METVQSNCNVSGENKNFYDVMLEKLPLEGALCSICKCIF